MFSSINERGKIDSSQIITYKNEVVNSTTITIYILKIVSGDKVWNSMKRYNNFFYFHSNLKLFYKGEIPNLPGKIIFDKKNDKKLEKRLNNLNIYLQKILKIQNEIMKNSRSKILFEEFFYSSENEDSGFVEQVL
jgi:hypothetical protein